MADIPSSSSSSDPHVVYRLRQTCHAFYGSRKPFPDTLPPEFGQCHGHLDRSGSRSPSSHLLSLRPADPWARFSILSVTPPRSSSSWRRPARSDFPATGRSRARLARSQHVLASRSQRRRLGPARSRKHVVSDREAQQFRHSRPLGARQPVGSRWDADGGTGGKAGRDLPPNP